MKKMVKNVEFKTENIWSNGINLHIHSFLPYVQLINEGQWVREKKGGVSGVRTKVDILTEHIVKIRFTISVCKSCASWWSTFTWKGSLVKTTHDYFNQAMEAGKPGCMSHLMAGHPAYEGGWGGPRQAHYLLQLVYVSGYRVKGHWSLRSKSRG